MTGHFVYFWTFLRHDNPNLHLPESNGVGFHVHGTNLIKTRM